VGGSQKIHQQMLDVASRSSVSAIGSYTVDRLGL